VAVVTDTAVVGHRLCIATGRPSVAGSPLLRFVQRDNADSDELRARNPWWSISATPGVGWRLLLGEGDRADGLALTIQIVA